MELIRDDTGEVLAARSYGVAEIPEGGSAEISLDEPIEGLYMEREMVEKMELV